MPLRNCLLTHLFHIYITTSSTIYVLTAIIIIIINDSVYGAVLMTMVTARVHPVHLMNAD